MSDTLSKIKVMQAFEAGKKIECIFKNGGFWISTKEPIWDWVWYKYRIKPESKMIPLDESDIILGKSIIRMEEWKYPSLIVDASTFNITIFTNGTVYNPTYERLQREGWLINHNNGIGEFVKCEKEVQDAE